MGEYPKRRRHKDNPYRLEKDTTNGLFFVIFKDGKNVFVGAHGNSIRALVKHIKHLSDDEIMDVEIPNFPPLVFEFDEDLNVTNEYYLGK